MSKKSKNVFYPKILAKYDVALLFPNVYERTVRNSTQTLKQSATECGPPNITSGDKKQKEKKKRMS